jgi:hypothetical protein
MQHPAVVADCSCLQDPFACRENSVLPRCYCQRPYLAWYNRSCYTAAAVVAAPLRQLVVAALTVVASALQQVAVSVPKGLTEQQQAANPAAGQHLRSNTAYTANTHHSNLHRQAALQC